MDEFEIVEWSDLREELKFESVILGNGASIAIDPCFSYGSLYEEATKGILGELVQKVFDLYNTKDFEFVLRILWRTQQVNDALGVTDEKVKQAYDQVRNALIETVHKVHVDYQTAHPHLKNICRYLCKFNHVISLNYDLIVYWAMLKGNTHVGGNRFKDCFVADGNTFEDDHSFMYAPSPGMKGSTLVFYPHGNLALATNFAGQEVKLCADECTDLLTKIIEQWSISGATPLFVSEGDSSQKRQAINRNGYLRSVYNHDLKNSSGGNYCIYGWSLSDQDNHLISAISKSFPKNIAISVFVGDQNHQKSCERIHTKLKGAYRGFRDTNIIFYDSSSPGCWINPE